MRSEWCKQGNSGKDRRLNNEQWSRIEQVTLARVARARVYWVTGWAWPCFMWEHGLVTLRVTIHRPRARKVGGRWAGTLGNSDKTLVIHGNVTRNEAPCFSVSGYRWVAAGQLDSALLFTNLHIYNNWHNRHVRHKTGSASPPGQTRQGDNNPELLSNNDLMVIWWLMLIRPNQQIDMANTLNTFTGRQKVEKLKLFSSLA